MSKARIRAKLSKARIRAKLSKGFDKAVGVVNLSEEAVKVGRHTK